MQSTLEHFGRLDVLVNNAGINIRKTPEKLTLPEWSEVLQVNLTGIFLCSRAAYPTMKGAGGGKIINIGSMLSIFGASFSPAYGASKGGVVQLTKSLASPGRRTAFRSTPSFPALSTPTLPGGAGGTFPPCMSTS